MKRGECTQPNPKLRQAAMQRQLRGNRFAIGRKAGGTAKPGWRPRKGRRLSSILGASCAYTFMSTSSLGELNIPLPGFALQQKFAAVVDRLQHLRAVQRESSRQAEHLFASLLIRAFRG